MWEVRCLSEKAEKVKGKTSVLLKDMVVSVKEKGLSLQKRKSRIWLVGTNRNH